MFTGNVLNFRSIVPFLLLFMSIEATAVVTVTASSQTSTSGNFSISWEQTGRHRNYTVVENGEDIATLDYIGGTGTIRNYPLSNKPPGQYDYQIRVAFFGGPPAISNTVRVNVTASVPSAPPNVRTSGNGGPFSLPTTVENGFPFSVNWDRQANASRYELQRRIDSGPWTLVQNDSSVSWTTTANESGNHVFRVRSCNAEDQCSGYTQSGVLTVNRPPLESNISFNDFTAPVRNDSILINTAFRLTWTDDTPRIAYALQYRRNAGSWVDLPLDPADVRYRNVSFSEAGDYTFRVRFNSPVGFGPYHLSKVVKVLRSVTPPAAPTNGVLLRQDSSGAYTRRISGGQIPAGVNYRISWQASSDADYYNLQSSTNFGSWVPTPTDITDTHFDFIGTNGHSSHRIFACRVGVCSTTPLQVSIQGGVPELPENFSLNIEGEANGEVPAGLKTISWPAVPTSDRYNLHVRLGGSTTWTPVATNLSRTSVEYNFSRSTEYQFRFTACDTTCSRQHNESVTAKVDNLFSDSSAGFVGEAFTGIIPPPSDTLLGSVSGAFRVAEDGAATYTIPIAVPEGVGGVQPNLSLIYSSRNKNAGYLGRGWSLSGLSSIYRCEGGSVYCFDGQRMILVEGRQHAIGAEYRLERDDFSKITIESSNPITFKLERADGTVSMFESRFGSDYWGISSFADRHGNRMVYRYVADAELENYRIRGIDYAFDSISGGTSQARVEFNYDNERDVRNRSVKNVSRGGTSDRRLTDISVYNTVGSDFGGDGSLNKITSYVMEYDKSDATGWKISHIHQCADYNSAISIASNSCLPATEFNWVDTVDSSDINVTDPETTSFGIAHRSKNAPHVQSFADFNGDGYQDIFWTELELDAGTQSQSTTLFLFYRTFNPETNEFDEAQFISGGRGHETLTIFDLDPRIDPVRQKSFGYFIEDFNYDGVMDLAIFAEKANANNDIPDNTWMIIPSTFIDGKWQLSFDDIIDTGISGTATTLGTNLYDVRIGDVNGDGLLDFVTTSLIYFGSYNENAPTRNERYHFVRGEERISLNELYRVVDIDNDGVDEVIGRLDAPPRVTERGTCDTYLGSAPGGGATRVDYEILEYNEHTYLYNFNSGNWEREIKQTRENRTEVVTSGNQPCFEDPRGREARQNDHIDVDTITNIYELAGVSFTRHHDINGDGLVDHIVARPSGSTLRYKLSGQPWTTVFSESAIPNAGSPRSPITFIDYDDDGDLDFVRFFGDDVELYSWVGGKYEKTQTLLTNTDSEFDRYFFVDVDSNGHVDMLNFDGREKSISFSGDLIDFLLDPLGTVVSYIGHSLSNPKHTVYDVHLYLNKNDGPQRAVDRITNGMGEIIEIDYENGVESDHYERHKVGEISPIFGYDIADGAAYHEWLNGLEDSYDFQANGSIRETINPGYIVASTKNTTGISLNASGRLHFSYISYYFGSDKAYASLRGSTGFEHLRIVDPHKQQITTTTNSQVFPFTSLPLSTVVETTNGHQVSETKNYYHYDEMEGLNGSHYFVKKHFSIDKAWNLPLSSSDTSGPLIKTTTTIAQYDNYNRGTNRSVLRRDVHGNKTFSRVIEKGVMVGGGSANDTRITSVTTTYHPSAEDLRFGRMDTVLTEVATSSDNDTVSSSQRFTYNSNGRVATETNRADTSYAVTTSYQYDNFGNVTRTDITDGLQERYTAAEFGAGNRYVHKTFDSLFTPESGRHLSHVVSRDVFGMATQIEDAQGVSGYAAHDQFGREYFTAADNGSWQTQYLTHCTSDCDVSFSVVWAVMEATSSDGSVSRVAMDTAGREVLVSTLGFDGRWVREQTSYNVAGQVLRKSQPFYDGDRVYWNHMTDYDELQRLTNASVPGPNNTRGEMSTSYNRYCKTETGPTGLTKRECTNALGQLMSSRDHDGALVSFEYNAFGDLKKMSDGTNITNIYYDDFGRKIGMTDPNKGRWHYCYTDFDELRLQVSANGHAIVEYYDELGRMESREDRRNVTFDPLACELTGQGQLESRTQWFYHTTSAATGSRGQLEKVEMENGQGALQYRESFFYDALGRSDRIETQFSVPGESGLQTFYAKQTYDAIGRVAQAFDGSSDSAFTRGGVESRYNQYGHMYQVVEASDPADKVYYQVNAVDAFGNVTESMQGNGVVTNEVYDPGTGNINYQLVGGGLPGYEAYEAEYEWDVLGNLTSRENFLNGEIETFTYDNLNRLREATVGTNTLETRYDPFGNITYKSDVGDYTYGSACGEFAAGPHAVCATSDGHNYRYDANGNMLQDRYGNGRVNRAFTYSVFDKATEIVKYNEAGSRQHTSRFWYGPSRSRYIRQDIDANNDVKTTLYLSGVERVSHADGKVEVKRYIGGKALVIDTHANGQNSGTDYQYLHHDHLGSLVAVSDGSSVDINRLSFDAWGARRYDDWTPGDVTDIYTDLEIMSVTDKTNMGYTGHEMVDEVGIIHMNGRIYDPRLARFMQADPHIQDPTYTQSLNRYAYVWNNPLNKTDPSGYFAQSAAGIIVAAYSVYNAAVSFYNFSNAVRSGDPGQIFIAAFGFAKSIAGFSGQSFGWSPSFENIWHQVIFDGVVGGIRAESDGGDFAKGFLTAGVTSYIQRTGAPWIAENFIPDEKEDQTKQNNDESNQIPGNNDIVNSRCDCIVDSNKNPIKPDAGFVKVANTMEDGNVQKDVERLSDEEVHVVFKNIMHKKHDRDILKDALNLEVTDDVRTIAEAALIRAVDADESVDIAGALLTRRGGREGATKILRRVLREAADVDTRREVINEHFDDIGNISRTAVRSFINNPLREEINRQKFGI